MPRGVLAVAETQEAAEAQVLAEAPQDLRVLRSREIDFTGLPPVGGRPLPSHWVVVVEHADPKQEAKLPQHEDPEADCEREARQMYLKMAIDPQLLITASIEEFACPACSERTRAELSEPYDPRYPEHATCSHCGTHLKRLRRSGAWDPIDSSSKPYPRCIFCGAPADSREHAIPAWISKRLAVNDFLSADDAFLAGRIERRKQDISFKSYRARIFCGECNTHFKHLEDGVIPLIVPMARGRSLSLDQDSQALLARWADKTAMALIAAIPELREAVPAGHRLAVRDQARVAPDTWVGFFPWQGRPIVSAGTAVVGNSRRSRSRRELYGAMLTFRQLGFYVIGLTGALEEGEVIDGERPPVRQFWPPRTRLLHWPPPGVADNRILPALLRFVPIRRT